MKRLALTFAVLVSWPMAAAAQIPDDFPPEAREKVEKLTAGIQAKLDAFKEVKMPPPGKTVDFSLKLGESTVTLESGDVFDGLRFTAPANLKGQDFVWYFNCPGEWSEWYILPAKGEWKQGFRNWYDADMLYDGVDKPGFEKRTRALQSLSGDYFTPGDEYVLWFKQRESSNNPLLTGRMMFAPHEEDWNPETMEKALGLKPAPAKEQVKLLDSRGGEILLDPKFFDPAYGKERVMAVFTNLRQTQMMRGGFFVTMESTFPPCKTQPKLSAIMSNYKGPDFVQTSHEVAKIRGKKPEGAPTTTYYYDYFGFVVDPKDPERKVLGVTAGAADYAQLKPGGGGQTYGRVALKNLTAFHNDQGAEVGRLYYFLEDGKKPLVIALPPPGTYRNGDSTLVHHGAGKWEWSIRYPDGQMRRQAKLADNVYDGLMEGFYPDGKPAYKLTYKKGLPDGELIQYTETGEIKSKARFKDGQLVEE